MTKFLTSYSPKKRIISTSTEPSLTDESFADECNISLMIERYKVSKIPPRTVNVSYGYSPSPDDFQNAQYLMAEVKTNFESLPSKIREEFGYDVQKYLAYIGDRDNLKDCYERGLVDPSSVKLEEIYPERYQTAVPEAPTEPSVNVEQASKNTEASQ